MNLTDLHVAVKAMHHCEPSPEQLAQVYLALQRDPEAVVAAAFHAGIFAPREWVENMKSSAAIFVEIKECYDRDAGREAILARVIENFRKTLQEVATEAVSTAYTDYLPYIETDTESNISYRVQGCVRNLVAGKFELVNPDSTLVSVDDSYGVKHFIDIGQYAEVVKPLVEAFAQELKDERIAQLESEVARLRESFMRNGA